MRGWSNGLMPAGILRPRRARRGRPGGSRAGCRRGTRGPRHAGRPAQVGPAVRRAQHHGLGAGHLKFHRVRQAGRISVCQTPLLRDCKARLGRVRRRCWSAKRPAPPRAGRPRSVWGFPAAGRPARARPAPGRTSAYFWRTEPVSAGISGRLANRNEWRLCHPTAASRQFAGDFVVGKPLARFIIGQAGPQMAVLQVLRLLRPSRAGKLCAGAATGQ